jgi:hypothetical protein
MPGNIGRADIPGDVTRQIVALQPELRQLSGNESAGVIAAQHDRRSPRGIYQFEGRRLVRGQ